MQRYNCSTTATTCNLSNAYLDTVKREGEREAEMLKIEANAAEQQPDSTPKELWDSIDFDELYSK